MKLYGSLSKLTSLLYLQNGFDITLTPDTGTTYTAARTLKLPPGDAASQVVGDVSTQTLTNKTISGASNTLSNISLTTAVTGTLPIANGGTNSATALNNNRFMVSTSGSIAEAAAVTASRALASDTNGLPTASATTSTELGYVSGVTSAIQTQLNGKAATALNNLTVAGLTAGDTLYATSSSAVARLGIGTTGQVLTVVAGNPAWSSPASSGSYATNWTASSFTATISNASPGVVTATAHGLVNGQALYFTTTGTLPAPLTPNTIYYVVAATANTFELAATYGGSAINTTSNGSGTHTALPTSINLVHNLNSLDVIVQLYDKADGSTITTDQVFRTDANDVIVNASAQPGGSGWRALVIQV